MTTIAALLPNDDHLTHAVETLAGRGVARERLRVLTQPAEVWQQLQGRRRVRIVFRDGLLGAGLGLVAGLLYAVPAGYLNCYLTGCPVSTSAALGLLVVAYWIAAGAFVGAIIGLNRLEMPLYSYMNGVRRGAALLLVDASDDEAPKVADILAHDSGMVVGRIDEDQ